MSKPAAMRRWHRNSYERYFYQLGLAMTLAGALAGLG